jgi:hypothetical protein
MELSILCDCEIALLIFSSNEKVFQYCSTDDIDRTLKRFDESDEPVQTFSNKDYGNVFSKNPDDAKEDVLSYDSDADREAPPKASPAQNLKAAHAAQPAAPAMTTYHPHTYANMYSPPHAEFQHHATDSSYPPRSYNYMSSRAQQQAMHGNSPPRQSPITVNNSSAQAMKTHLSYPPFASSHYFSPQYMKPPSAERKLESEALKGEKEEKERRVEEEIAAEKSDTNANSDVILKVEDPEQEQQKEPITTHVEYIPTKPSLSPKSLPQHPTYHFSRYIPNQLTPQYPLEQRSIYRPRDPMQKEPAPAEYMKSVFLEKNVKETPELPAGKTLRPVLDSDAPNKRPKLSISIPTESTGLSDESTFRPKSPGTGAFRPISPISFRPHQESLLKFHDLGSPFSGTNVNIEYPFPEDKQKNNSTQ